MDVLTGGLNDLLLSNKQIKTETEHRSTNKLVKLRFTRKQYEAFRDACKVMEIVSSHEGFVDFVKEALNADIKLPTIARQFVNPILEAPMRIPVKSTKREQKKVTYFTSPIDATDKCIALFSQVADTVALKQDIGNGKTSLTDIRVMINTYLTEKNLKTDDGIVLDEFIMSIAQETVEYNKNSMLIINDKYIIPKGDKKIIPGIVNEIAFDKTNE